MAFKSEEVYLKGKGKWIKAVVPDQLYNKWSVVLYPDTDSLEKVRELQLEGLKNRLRKDDEGYNVNFSRPVSKENKKSGQLMTFQPPKVVDKEGNPMDGVAIGNGSDITIKLEVYSHAVPGSSKTAKAARLASIRVDNLIPFNKEKDFTPEEAEQISGLKEQPEPLF